jgi:hypothetical protein
MNGNHSAGDALARQLFDERHRLRLDRLKKSLSLPDSGVLLAASWAARKGRALDVSIDSLAICATVDGFIFPFSPPEGLQIVYPRCRKQTGQRQSQRNHKKRKRVGCHQRLSPGVKRRSSQLSVRSGDGAKHH